MAERLFIYESFDKYSENVFLKAGELSVTYKETFELIKQAIPVVHNLPVAENRFVGIVTSLNVHTIINLFAVLLSGNIAVLVSDKEPENRINEQLNEIGCRTRFDKQSIQGDKTDLNRNQQVEDEATVLFSSGSTSSPKAVIHTFRNHYYSALGSNENIPLARDDRWLLSLPLSHVSGLSILFRTLIAGATVVVQDRQLSLVENIEKFSITHLSLVETQLQELLKTENSYGRLKSVLVGGSKISKQLIQKAYKRNIPIRTTYGSTEMASQITTTDENESLEKLYTSGKLLSHRELKIADDGEILVRGKTLCKRYIGREMPADKDGWFQTADIGNLDDEGYLTVLGRKDNMFISGGENIYPEEIESMLMESDLFTTAVIVANEDETFGFVPVLFYQSAEEVNLETIQQLLRDRLPKFKFPKEMYKLPKEYKPTGIKADRKFLFEWLKKNQR